MNRLKLFATATLMALVFTACDEGTPPPVEPPPPPTPVGTISGAVTIENTAASGITATLSSGATTTTGSGGNFAFSGVEAGTYTVTISGYPEDATFANVTQSATIATDGQNVQLTFDGEYIRSSSVVGNVVAADAMMSGGDGQPETLAGVTVTLGGEYAMGETMQTDAETGGFAFTGLRAGTYTVTISDYPEDVSFETVMVEVTVEVGDVGQAGFTGHFIRTSAVEGQVIIEGEGLAGVTVTLSGGPADEMYTIMTDADGMYRFEELRPGSYTVSIADFDPRDYEFAATSQDVSVDLDETGTVSFTGVLLRTSGISGRVSVEGMGLGEIAVTLSGADDRSTMTDASGQYAFAGLAAGDYTVSIAVESAAYVFDSMSSDVTVGDDESAIVNFEGAHDTSASLTAMLFIDEGSDGRNNMHDEGEDAFPSAAMVQALQGLGVPVPAALPVPVTLVGPEVNQMTSGVLSLATGQVAFAGLRAGTYQLRVGSLSALLPALPAEAAAILRDYDFGGPADGYTVEIGVGDQATQAIPVDITHTTINVAVTLNSPVMRGEPIPGAGVDLFSDAAGDTKIASGMTVAGEHGAYASIRIARDGTSDNTVHMAVSADGYFVDPTAGLQAVTWYPQSPVHPAPTANPPAVLNDATILNLNADVSFSGAMVDTGHPDSGKPLGGWLVGGAVVDPTDPTNLTPLEDVSPQLDAEGMAAFTETLAVTDLPRLYAFDVAMPAIQPDVLDGGEEFESMPATYLHTGLTLAGTADAGTIEVQYTTQTLKVYVHHERDQVEGYTGNVLGGDVRMSGMVDVEVRYINDSGRSAAFTDEMWDASKNTKDDKKGGLTFSHLPAGMNVIVTAEAAADADIMVLDPDELATFEDLEDNGVLGGAFGDMGGFSPSVTLCPLQKTAPQDFGDCASFAFVNTYSVNGQVWKNGVERNDDDGFDTHEIDEDPIDPVPVKDIAVDMEAVEGKNIVKEGNSHNSTDEDGDATIKFDFERMADGVYALSVSDGWVATAGMGGAKLPEEFLLSNEVDDDGHLNIDVTPTTGVLYGYVNLTNGQAAEGVKVDVNGSYDVTDEFGRYIVEGFGAGEDEDGDDAMIVTLSGEDFSEKMDTIHSFAANELAPMTFEVEGAAEIHTISGTVTANVGGAGVPGVRISVTGSSLVDLPTSGTNKGKLVTGADGSYVAKVVALPAGQTVTVSASADTLSFSSARVVAPSAGLATSGMDFIAFAHARITGRVLDEDGTPVERVEVTATLVGASSPADSYTTRRTGTFRLSVPFGTYDIAVASDGYVSTYPNGVQRHTVAPGQRLAFGDIEATISAAGRPPRFTSSASFSVEEGKRTIGTVEAVDDDDDDEVTGYSVSGGDDSEMFAITPAGVLSWAATRPPFKKATEANPNPDNKYEVDVDATSGPKASATDATTTVMSATQEITVTVTASGNLVVTLEADPDEISENSETSTVTATLNREAESAFYVVVTVSDDTEVELSGNTRLFFDEGDDESTGVVTITAINDDNVHNSDRTVTVSGTPEPASNDIDVESDELTITDDDTPYGQVRLVLKRSRISETDDGDTDNGNQAQDTLTATLVGGTTFDAAISIAVTMAPAEAVEGGGTGTLTILAGSRSSALNADGTAKTADAQVVIEAAGDDVDAGNTVVTVSGVVSVDGTELDADDDSQPDDVILVILDDDDAPSAVRNPEVAPTADAADDEYAYELTWDAPSNPGTVNGTAVVPTTLTYEYRVERSSVIGDATWASATSPQAINLVNDITAITADNWRERSFTVQVRITGDDDTMVEKEFTTPAAP